MTQQSVATLAGGCFWCLESAFNQLRGVIHAESGYSNGFHSNPTYELVCGGDTGHAEVVRITFDESIISYRELLEIFFALHNPTQLNRQGNDIGSQYRGGIYFHDEYQQQIALEIIEEISSSEIWDDPIVTEVLPIDNYFKAEEYHQDYFNNNPQNTYCNMVVAPKLVKFKQTFSRFLK